MQWRSEEQGNGFAKLPLQDQEWSHWTAHCYWEAVSPLLWHQVWYICGDQCPLQCLDCEAERGWVFDRLPEEVWNNCWPLCIPQWGDPQVPQNCHEDAWMAGCQQAKWMLGHCVGQDASLPIHDECWQAEVWVLDEGPGFPALPKEQSIPCHSYWSCWDPEWTPMGSCLQGVPEEEKGRSSKGQGKGQG